MRSNCKKVTSVVVMIILSLIMVMVAGLRANAADKGPVKFVQNSTMYEHVEQNNGYWGSVYPEPNKKNPTEADYKIIDKKCKLVSVKSSNTKVLKANKGGNSLYDISLEQRNPGKSTITVKYKYKSKTYKYSVVCKVKKYPNPYKSIKVNGKNINIKDNKFYYDFYKYKKTSTTIKVTPKKGWKIVDAYYQIWDSDKLNTLKPKDVEKGAKIKIPKGKEGGCFVYMENSKGDDIMYGIRFSRKSS